MIYPLKLRGGGACVARPQQIVEAVIESDAPVKVEEAYLPLQLPDEGIQKEIEMSTNERGELQKAVDPLSDVLQSLEDNFSKLGTSEGKNQIYTKIAWLQENEEQFYSFGTDFKAQSLSHEIMVNCLSTLLQLAVRTIKGDKFITLQILKVSNYFSRAVFSYYLQSKDHMSQDKIDEFKQLITNIEQFIQSEGEQQLFFNGIFYELQIVKFCVETIPYISDEGEQIGINLCKSIFTSLFAWELSTDIYENLIEGFKFIMQKAQEKEKKFLFRLCLQIEQMKWIVQKQIESNVSIYLIFQYMNNVYISTIQKITDWTVQYSWIKTISQILIMKPTITLEKFVRRFQSEELWEDLSNKGVIKIINYEKGIGIILPSDIDDQIVNMLQEQLLKHELLQDSLMKGFQSIPSFTQYYYNLINDSQIKEEENNNELLFEFVKKIEIINFDGYVHFLATFSLKLEELIRSLSEFDNELKREGYQKQKLVLNNFATNIQFQISFLITNLLRFQVYDEYFQHVLTQFQNIFLGSHKQSDKFMLPKYLILFIAIYEKIFSHQQADTTEGVLKKICSEIEESSETKKEYQALHAYFVENKVDFFKNPITSLKLLIQKETESQWIQRITDLIKNFHFQVANQQQAEQLLHFLVQQNIEITQIKIQIQLDQQSDNDNVQKVNTDVGAAYLKMIDFLTRLKFLQDKCTKLKTEFQDNFTINEFKTLEKTSNIQMFNPSINQTQLALIYMNSAQRQLKFTEFKIAEEKKYLQIYLETSQGDNRKVALTIQYVKQFERSILENQKLLAQTLSFIENTQKWLVSTEKKRIKILSSLPTQENLENIKKVSVSLVECNIDEQDVANIKSQLNYYKRLDDMIHKLKIGIKGFLFQSDRELLNEIQQLSNFLKFLFNQNYDIINQEKQKIILASVRTKKEILVDTIQKWLGKQTQEIQFVKQKSVHNHPVEIFRDYSMSSINDLIGLCNTKLQAQSFQTQITAKTNSFQITAELLDQLQSNSLLDSYKNLQSILFLELDEISKLYFQWDSEMQNAIQEITKLFNIMLEIIENGQDTSKPNEDAFQEISYLFIKQRPQEEILNQGQKQNQLTKYVLDFLEQNQWRVKECYIFNSIIIQNQLSQQNYETICKQLIIISAKESDYRVKATLKNKENIQIMVQIFSKFWNKVEKSISEEINELLNKIQALQFQIQGAENETIRSQLFAEHKRLEDQVEQVLNNVEEIGDMLGITIAFLKDIRKELQKIQKQLGKLIEKIDEIGQDIKFLRGKTPRQLFEVRMEQVLQAQILNDAKSVYVQVKTKEQTQYEQVELDVTPLFSNQQENNGEVNEFIDLDIKDTFLIHGPAGSGKSLAAKKVEEFLWKQYKESISKYTWSEKQDIVPVIPIFIQLPSLKDPKQNAVEETLQSFQYNFDTKQISEFKDQVTKGYVKIIFILDSYDELSKQYQGWNLIITNRLKLWKNEVEMTIYPKIITTSRSEAFVTQNYKEWFCADEPINLNKYKEVRILKFDETQRAEFLNQSSKLQIKTILMEFYEMLGKKKQRAIDISLVIDPTWQIIEKNFLQNQKDDTTMLNENEVEQIIQIMRKDDNIIDVNQEQEVHLKKQLLSVWSKTQYEQCIKSMELQKFLETPFMVNIVIQVLPSLFQKVSQPEYLKEPFLKNYVRIKDYQKDSENKLVQFQKKKKDISYEDSDPKATALSFWGNLIQNKFFNYFNASHNLEETNQLLKQHFQSNKIDVQEKEIMTLARALKSYSLEAIDFYQQFFDQYSEKQIKKLQFRDERIDYEIFRQDVQFYATQLAINFMNNQETGVEYKQKGLINQSRTFKDAYFTFFDLNDKLSKYKAQLRKCIPLKQKGNYISFNHKSIQEYLMAQETLELFYRSRTIHTDIYNQVKQLPSQMSEYNVKNILDQILKHLIDNQFEDLEQQTAKLHKVKKRILNDYILIEHKRIFTIIFNQIEALLSMVYNAAINQIIWSDQFYIGSIKFMMKKIENHHSIIEQLCFLVTLSRYSNLYINASSNALQLIAFSQDLILLRDFSKIQIKDVQLTGLKCVNCKFKRSTFSNVNLQGANLNFCNLGLCKWSDITTSEAKNLEHHDQVFDIAISPKGDLIATTADKRIQIWNALTGKLIEKSSRGNHNYLRMQFSPSGVNIVTSNRRGIVHFWIAQTCKKLKDKKIYAHVGFIYNVLYSPDGQQIVTCGDDMTLKFWNVEKAQEDSRIQSQKSKFVSMAYTPNGDFIVTGDAEGRLAQWNMLDKTLFREFAQIENILISDLVFSPDGERLAAACDDKNLRIFDFNSGHLQVELLHGGKVTSLAYSSDNLLIVTGSSDYNVRIWDAKTFKQKGEALIGHNDEITAVAISPDVKTIVSGSVDKTARIWDAQPGKKISNQLQGHEGQVLSVQYSPDGKSVVSGGTDLSIKLWEAKTGKEIPIIFNGHTNNITSVAFNSDGSTIASASDDGTIRFWSVTTGKEIKKPIFVQGRQKIIMYSNEGSVLACVSQNPPEIVFIRPQSGEISKKITLLQEPISTNSKLFVSLAFFHSLPHAIYCFKHEIVQLELENFNEIGRTPAATGFNVQPYISCLDINYDDSRIVTCSVNGPIRLKLGNFPFVERQSQECSGAWIVKFSENGKQIVVAHIDNYLQILDGTTLKVLQTLPQLHKNRITSLSFSPDNKNIASSSNDKTIRIWSSENLKRKKKYDRLSLEEILAIQKIVPKKKNDKKQFLKAKTIAFEIPYLQTQQLLTESKVFYQQLCISKVPMIIQFHNVKHKDSDIKSKTNVDLVKEWKSI